MNKLTPEELKELTQLAQKMANFNVEEHLGEVAYNIWCPKYASLLQDFNNIKQWTIHDVSNWIVSLMFLGSDVSMVTNKLYEEFIDGQFLFSMDQKVWVKKLGLKYSHFLLIEFIFHGWAFGLKTLRLPSDIHKLGKFQVYC